MEPIEATAVAVQQDTDAELFNPEGGGLFETSVAVMLEKKKAMDEFIGKVMVENEDYGLIPGCDKKILLKPGGEKLAQLYALRFSMLEVECKRHPNDWAPTFILYRYKCVVYNKHGEAIAECEATASSGERVHQRTGTRDVFLNKATPEEIEIGKTVERTSKKGGKYKVVCITEDIGPSDLENSICKKAQKRAYMGAVQTATRLSNNFTHDIEEDPGLYGYEKPGTTVKEPEKKKRGRPVGSTHSKPLTNTGGPVAESQPLKEGEKPTDGSDMDPPAEREQRDPNSHETIHEEVCKLLGGVQNIEGLERVWNDYKDIINAMPDDMRNDCINRKNHAKLMLEKKAEQAPGQGGMPF